jgi:hypothetical protein
LILVIPILDVFTLMLIVTITANVLTICVIVIKDVTMNLLNVHTWENVIPLLVKLQLAVSTPLSSVMIITLVPMTPVITT